MSPCKNPSKVACRYGLFLEWKVAVQQAKAHDKAKDAYEKAATGNERQGSPFHAAKDLEKAGEAATALCAWEQVKDFYSRAAQAFGEANRGSAAAESLMKCAKQLETHDPQVGACSSQGQSGFATVPVLLDCRFPQLHKAQQSLDS